MALLAVPLTNPSRVKKFAIESLDSAEVDFVSKNKTSKQNIM